MPITFRDLESDNNLRKNFLGYVMFSGGRLNSNNTVFYYFVLAYKRNPNKTKADIINSLFLQDGAPYPIFSLNDISGEMGSYRFQFRRTVRDQLHTAGQFGVRGS